MKKTKTFLLILVILSLMNLVIAGTSVGTSELTRGRVIYTPPIVTNYSLFPTVNSSAFWDSLDLPQDIQYSDINADSNFWDSNINIGAYDFTTTGDIRADTITVDAFINHYGDADTYIRFFPDMISFTCGDTVIAQFIETTPDTIQFFADIDLSSYNLTTTGDVSGKSVIASSSSIGEGLKVIGGSSSHYMIITAASGIGGADRNLDFNLGGANRIVYPYDVSGVRVRQEADQEIVRGGWRKLEFPYEDWDLGIEFTLNTFTAKVEGYYQVNLVAALRYLAIGKRFLVGIYKEGVVQAKGEMLGAGASAISATVTDIVHLEIGETIEGYMYHNDAVNRDTVGGSGYTYMSIHRISN